MADQADRRARVLWLIKGLGPGGAEQLLVSVARVRDREAFDYEAAYLLPWKDHLAGALSGLGVPAHCLDVRHPADLRWAGRLRRFLLAGRFDVVHVHSPMVAGIARLVVRSVPARRRPRLVTTEHNIWSTYALPTRLINGLTYRLGDAWLAVSHDVHHSIPQRLRSRVETLVHGLDLEAIRAEGHDREATRRELGLRPDEVAVCTVANYRRQKGYPDLLAAARMVLDGGHPVRFVAVGQGPLEAEIVRMHAELGLGDRFLLLGYRPDAARVLAACDLFALASLHEGYPIAVMEALAVGVPVVATRVGGVPDAVEDGVHGLIIPPGRPDLLATAIAGLAADPARRLGMAAAAAAKGIEYDIRPVAHRIERIYRDLLSS